MQAYYFHLPRLLRRLLAGSGAKSAPPDPQEQEAPEKQEESGA